MRANMPFVLACAVILLALYLVRDRPKNLQEVAAHSAGYAVRMTALQTRRLLAGFGITIR